MSVFIQPPSVKELRKRLKGRGTDAPEVIESRIAKAEFELGFADKFDTVIVNDDLEKAKAEALKVIKKFLLKNKDDDQRIRKNWPKECRYFVSSLVL